MTKEEKQARKHKRCEKRRANKKDNIQKAINIYREYSLSWTEAKQLAKNGVFLRGNGYMQICDYKGLCSSPCV